MEDFLSVSTVTGDFEPVKDLKGGPVPPETVRENIRESAKIELPIFIKRPPQKGSMIFIAGGPSLRDFIDEIKKRADNGECIVTSNKTYDYLVSKNIVANVCVIVDPKEIVKTYIQNPQKETLFCIGAICHKEVTTRLLDKEMNVEKLLVGYGLDDESDIKLQKELYPGYHDYLVGGTMMGLRAMNFAPLMGFSKIEYYGFDSCFSNKTPELIESTDPRYKEIKEQNGGMYYIDAATGKEYTINEPDGGFFYAYKKKRNENVLVIKTSDGRAFLTSPCFAHQAKQLIKWLDRVEGKTEVIIHGDSLSSHMLKCYREKQEELKKEIGDRRWTDEYAKTQFELHKRHRYGWSGEKVGGRQYDTELAGRGILGLYHVTNKDRLTVLDYGCGQGILSETLTNIFNILDITKYDPFMPEYWYEPEGKFDVVVCFDVMEHVEIQCIDNVLKHIAEKTRYLCLMRIGIGPAKKTLCDGRNAHITQKHPNWWYKQLERHFIVAEGIYIDDYAYFTLQSMDASETVESEKQSNDGGVKCG